MKTPKTNWSLWNLWGGGVSTNKYWGLWKLARNDSCNSVPAKRSLEACITIYNITIAVFDSFTGSRKKSWCRKIYSISCVLTSSLQARLRLYDCCLQWLNKKHTTKYDVRFFLSTGWHNIAYQGRFLFNLNIYWLYASYCNNLNVEMILSNCTSN